MAKDNYFSCLNCQQDIISKKKEIKKCPKCGEKFVIDVIVVDMTNFRRMAVTV